jgi:hypothetical protein
MVSCKGQCSDADHNEETIGLRYRLNWCSCSDSVEIINDNERKRSVFTLLYTG